MATEKNLWIHIRSPISAVQSKLNHKDLLRKEEEKEKEKAGDYGARMQGTFLSGDRSL